MLQGFNFDCFEIITAICCFVHPPLVNDFDLSVDIITAIVPFIAILDFHAINMFNKGSSVADEVSFDVLRKQLSLSSSSRLDQCQC